MRVSQSATEKVKSDAAHVHKLLDEEQSAHAATQMKLTAALKNLAAAKSDIEVMRPHCMRSHLHCHHYNIMRLCSHTEQAHCCAQDCLLLLNLTSR